MNKRSDVAVQKFNEGFNCAQAVLFSFTDELHLDKETALKLACGFGGGMGRMQEVCGAVSGGIAVIGYKYGRGENGPSDAIATTYAKVLELMTSFERENGSYICKNLLHGCDLKTGDGQKEFKEAGMKKGICEPCVRSVVEIVEKIL
ncbi:MAG TPA: C-GCAxxG-C-C family protein [Chitinispirillaceae bacterium]|nr:C-GCAxxG-C-C family protein [Chitinispirillaceae bacterium]